MAGTGRGAAQVRRLWTVLVLAAVLSMHGTPVLAAGTGAEPSTLGLAAAASSSMATAPTHGTGQAGAIDESGQRPVGSHVPGHGVDAHLWAACLAILLAGVTLVAAALRLRTGGAPLLRGPTRWSARSPCRRRVARPPDLFVLCLLRV